MRRSEGEGVHGELVTGRRGCIWGLGARDLWLHTSQASMAEHDGGLGFNAVKTGV